MGYTHYWYTDPVLDKENFSKVVADFEKMIPVMEHLGVKLAGGLGEGKPEFDSTHIWFNGLRKCGHQDRDLGIVWPAKQSQGVADLAHQHLNGNGTKANVSGKWFAGLQLDSRTCDGDCSHETFNLQQKTELSEFKQSLDSFKTSGKVFDCCKTAYKPYDLAVNICLIIAKHNLKDQIIIHSDGEIDQWKDAIEITKHFLGYGSDFNLDEELPYKKPKEPEIQATQNNDIKVGDIFYSSWGYDQTNIDYYKVVSISPTKKTVKIIRICSKTLENTGFMSERVVPNPDSVYLETEWINNQPVKVKKEYRATVRTDRNGKIWLRCGKTYGGYLWVYDGPNTATYYA